MNAIIFPQEQGAQGPDVANLQDALFLLLARGVMLRDDGGTLQELSSRLREERHAQVYQDATHNLVGIFQDTQGIQPGNWGAVDEATAKNINDLLRQFGVLDGGGWNHVVEALHEQNRMLGAISEDTDHLASIDDKIGAVGRGTEYLASINDNIGNLGASGRPPTVALNARDAAVRDLQTQLGMIGVALPEREVADGVFGIGTRDALLQLQAKNNLSQTGVLDDATRNALQIAVESAANRPRVEGRIFLENGLPAAKIKLQIVKRGFGEDETILDATETDERGYYSLPYDDDGIAPNIEVRTFDTDGNIVRLSRPKVKAARNEVLNLVAPSAVRSKMNEWELLTADLTTEMGGDLGKLATAQESSERQDLSLLHQATSWDARLIATAAVAAKASDATGIAHDALYGAIRAGLPDDPDALAMVSSTAFAAALERAQAAELIALDPDAIANAVSAFEQHKLTTRRSQIIGGTLSNVGEMVDRARIESTNKELFANIAATHDGDAQALWSEAKTQGIQDTEIKMLQLQGKLAFLTLNNAPLTDDLLDDIASQDDLGHLVELGLYHKGAWAARLEALAGDNPETRDANLAKLIPASYTQPELNDRVQAYSEDMARKVRQTFPTRVVQHKLAKDELSLGANHAATKPHVQTLLSNAASQGFQLGRTPVTQFLAQHQTVFAGIDADKQALATDGVKILARAYQMTPNDESMTTLLGLGFNSARQVTAISKADFVERYWSHFGSRTVTETVYDKSVQITSVTSNIFTVAKKLESTPPVLAISGNAQRHDEAKRGLKNLLKEYPTMESLFGALDFCECEHCRSVLSPAAYLVDLLRFIDPREDDWQHTLEYWKQKRNGKGYSDPPYNYLKPYDAFIERRADIPHLPLTCENTNTAVPYIDLVNEILEYFIEKQGLDEGAVYDTGEATSAELIAEPQNIIPAVYDTLREARYPLSLPFDLWLETVRRFTAYFETPFWHVLDVFRPTDELHAEADQAYDRADVWRERLGLTPGAYKILTAPAFADWPTLYGYDTETEAEALTHLQSARTLAKRLGVSYKEMVELVQTTFVNPRSRALALVGKLRIEVSDVFRYEGHAGYPAFTAEETVEYERRLAEATARFGPPFDAKQRLHEMWEQGQFEQVVVLRDDDGGCNFDQTRLQYAGGTAVDALVLVRLNLFVRLWKHLGWTMEETDAALQAFMPRDVVIDDTTLGAAIKTALIYVAHLQELASLIDVGKNGYAQLLTLWTPIPTHGKNSLYAQLFLARSIRKDDAVFDHPLGDYLSDTEALVKDHLPALQAALNLTAAEIALILKDGATGDDSDIDRAKLSLPVVSKLYRYPLLARAMKLSIPELIILKTLSGCDPFRELSGETLTTIKEDYPWTHTLQFVGYVEQLQASAFSIADLDYLLRHREDALAPLREDVEANLASIKALSASLQTIAADYAVPTSADDLTDDVLQQRMSLAFAADVVEGFMTYWHDSYTASKDGVPPSQRLAPATYAIEGVSVAYDETSQRQHLAHRGILTAEGKEALLLLIPVPLASDQDAVAARQNFADLLEQVVQRSSTQGTVFFAKHFDGRLRFDDFFSPAAPTALGEKRLAMLRKLLPLLEAKLAQQTIVAALSARTSSEAQLIETVITRNDILALPDAPTDALVATFTALAQPGLTATLRTSEPDVEPEPMRVHDVRLEVSNAYEEGTWSGYIEVSRSGSYRFYAELGKQNATATLRFDGVTEPVLHGSAAQDGGIFTGEIELKAGTLYGFTFAANNLQNGTCALLVKGETTSKVALSTLGLLPRDAVDGALAGYTLVRKTLQIVEGLGLSDRDLQYISTHRVNFEGVDLRLLPTRRADEPNVATAEAVQLFTGMMAMLDYATLKRDMAGGSNEWVSLFEQALTTPPGTIADLCARIATLTRRTSEVVGATATALQMTDLKHFADRARLRRLWQALQIVEVFGIGVESLRKWATPTPDAGVARDVQRAIKSRYETATWQRIAQAIFDPLRQKRRDALVAHIMHLRPELDSVPKLFEYFLIDPGTEPVVHTSRLRLAISSLQTFIQRCFLNLEPRVHPSMLNAQHWSWMKRYRVWEANRKIFLFPENWLEPEWRDDKTHLFQELEGTLLQGDVSNQLAEDALYVYLQKLHQLARLDIVTMYAEEKPQGPPTMHVLGRTHATPHQYFYRRYAHRMWTPWEPVSAEIDGEHTVMVVWRNRLFLFWLTFMERVEQTGDGLETKQTGELGTLKLNALVEAAGAISKGAVKRTLDVQLNWSEYSNGEWTVRESSGFGNVINLHGPFDPSRVFVTVSKDADPENGRDGAVWIILKGLWQDMEGFHSFHVISKNSRPRFGRKQGDAPGTPYRSSTTHFNRFRAYHGSGPLTVTFVQRIVTTDGSTKADPPAPQTILAKVPEYTFLQSSNQLTLPSKEFAPLISPIFYADDMYTFFVEPTLTETTVDKWEGYTITRPSQKPRWDEYVEKPKAMSPVIPAHYLEDAVIQTQLVPKGDPVDQLSIHAIKSSLDVLTEPGIAVQFGDAIIGRTGLVRDLDAIKAVITSVGDTITL